MCPVVSQSLMSLIGLSESHESPFISFSLSLMIPNWSHVSSSLSESHESPLVSLSLMIPHLSPLVSLTIMRPH